MIFFVIEQSIKIYEVGPIFITSNLKPSECRTKNFKPWIALFKCDFSEDSNAGLTDRPELKKRSGFSLVICRSDIVRYAAKWAAF
jgi:hypothetical protein